MPHVMKLPAYQWYNPREVDYPVPDEWHATLYNIAGVNRPVMTDQQIAAAINSPIGSPRLKDIAKGKRKVVILFDDLTRGTRVYRIVPAVLQELKEAGIADNQIEFICAGAAHQAWDRADLAKKLGEGVFERFPVYNHVPFLSCSYLGKTSYGSRVEINAEVMSCDLKIGIGGIVPHASYGFGGGAKIIMPGVSSYDAIAAHHGATHAPFKEERKKAGHSFHYGFVDTNPLTLDAIEMARMVGVDFIVNGILNYWGEPVNIYAGALEPAYWAGVKEAKSHYRVEAPQDNDIVISNAFCKGNEAYHAMQTAIPHVKRKGGDLVIVTTSPLGWVYHYLTGSHGRTVGGRNQVRFPVPEYIKNVIVYSEFPEFRTVDRFAGKDQHKVLLVNKWEDVIKTLQAWHGTNTKVAVFPDGTMQLSG
jgi:nickel-dependent lactate racemase